MGVDSEREPLRIGVSVSTNRKEEIRHFLSAWEHSLLSAAREGKITFVIFVHEDGPFKSFPLPTPPPGCSLVHTAQDDIDQTLGERGWIIPRRSGASRSFPMYLAWKEGCHYVITLDDDCLPPSGQAEGFFERHLEAFRMDRWFRTVSGEEPRGVPYGDKGHLPVLLNHGLWTDSPDLDAPTALVRGRWPVAIVLRASREIVPPGMWFPLSAMNVCYDRRAIPAAYNLLMGLEATGLDRFDDIWSGLFLKRIADQLGYYIASGIPFVRHAKASDPFANLRKEALGMGIHERFWLHVAAAPLDGVRTVARAYTAMADWVAGFPQAHPSAPAPPGYFERLARAMKAWGELFLAEEE